MIKRKPQQKTSSSSDSGFTIIESVLGVVVVAILLASVSPLLVFSTATRVQSRRAEKATQVVNTLITALRTSSIKAPGEFNAANKILLEAATAAEPRNLADNLISLAQMPVPANASNLYLVKKDESICHTSQTGCTSQSKFEEYYIQARQLIVTGSAANDGYRLAVRVYRGDVDFTKPLLASDVSIQKTASVVTAGVGNRQAPLIERTVDIANGRTSFEALCQRLGIVPAKDGNNQNCQ
ncbi:MULTISPECIES: hormogonium polysaccharide secretion pseudopilin HpsB [unclassified Nodularia (in: cyanobacteria)]|uniref:hormogonium polysaccharide secretion pseudopilin HpsB n=1 Tax=unclassified Nodularia (in: cyanobacteria) TaxID=2656917 RepID=UPI001881E20D|nr:MULTISPECIES: hormogonium polysaccharide secretion pseudopilin HpsB [unclassified Nodularia (in: cyanobacteria)]MBE9201550.1 type II secretion system protein [Nodularia sp. LEGE 06071]MCC2695743.1 type II secretion system protein [Nodularia sp. LEGE 04288]